MSKDFYGYKGRNQKTDDKIDDVVYDLYDLTAKEIEIVEGGNA